MLPGSSPITAAVHAGCPTWHSAQANPASQTLAAQWEVPLGETTPNSPCSPWSATRQTPLCSNPPVSNHIAACMFLKGRRRLAKDLQLYQLLAGLGEWPHSRRWQA